MPNHVNLLCLLLLLDDIFKPEIDSSNSAEDSFAA